MSIFCKHKFGEIKEGYQYCEKCGKAILVPCNHKWEIIQKIDVLATEYSKFPVKTQYVCQCKICGEIKVVTI